MLQWLHNEFGLIGSLIAAYIIFFLFIFWIAGLAGINESKQPPKRKMTMIIIGIFFFPYPVIWLISEIYHQHKVLNNGWNR